MDSSQNIHHEVFSSCLANYEILLQSGAGYKFEMQNDPTCTNIGFSTSALPKDDRIWRKGTTKFSCSHLAVDISRCLASNCAGKPPVSMRRSVPRYRARKKGGCIGRKQESIFESEAWTYISCSRPNTNSVFRRVLYRRERRAAT